jgi:hypothetical protein
MNVISRFQLAKVCLGLVCVRMRTCTLGLRGLGPRTPPESLTTPEVPALPPPPALSFDGPSCASAACRSFQWPGTSARRRREQQSASPRPAGPREARGRDGERAFIAPAPSAPWPRTGLGMPPSWLRDSHAPSLHPLRPLICHLPSMHALLAYAPPRSFPAKTARTPASPCPLLPARCMPPATKRLGCGAQTGPFAATCPSWHHQTLRLLLRRASLIPIRDSSFTIAGIDAGSGAVFAQSQDPATNVPQPSQTCLLALQFIPLRALRLLVRPARVLTRVGPPCVPGPSQHS